jgi:subtilisin family serine protease
LKNSLLYVILAVETDNEGEVRVMKKMSGLMLRLGLVLLIIIGGMVMANEVYAAGKRVIVVFEPASANALRRNIVLKANCSIIRELSIVPSVVVYLPEQASERARNAILSHTSVIRIEDDIVMEAYPKPEKPEKPDGGKPPKEDPQPNETLPWGVGRIGAESAWISSTGAGVKVAILDTGIDTEHPDLAANIAGGVNIINSRKHYKDDNGHGTHVAGIVAAIDNDIGVIGVAPQSLLYGIKALDRNGKGWLSDIVAGLQWSIQNQVDVVNMSLGSADGNQTLYEAVAAVNSAGIVQVASAGNEGRWVSYPAAYEEVIAVSAADESDNVPFWSNYGPEIDLTAPGVAIISTYIGSTYTEFDGTSMSAPHVSGTVALILENQPGYSPAQINNVLTSTAEDLGLSDLLQGAGLVDAEAAAFITE